MASHLFQHTRHLLDNGRESSHLGPQIGNFFLEVVNLLLTCDLVRLVGFLQFFEQIRAAAKEIVVLKSPPFGLTRATIIGGEEKAGVFHLPEPIQVQLTDKTGKVVVLEKLRNDGGRKEVRIFDNEGESVVRPTTKVGVK